jgi:amino acid transporter
LMFAGTTRLPMVAGWDGLLPKWFTRLHPRYLTPVNSILFVGATTFIISSIGLLGVGKQEAFQLLWNSAGIFYGLTYLVMFAIPLIGLRGVTPRPPWWVKISAASGLVITLLYTVLSLFPIIQVASVAAFALKITLVVVLLNLVGVGILIAGKRRSNVIVEPGA